MRKRKVASVLLAAVITTSALAACGGTAEENTTPEGSETAAVETGSEEAGTGAAEAPAAGTTGSYAALDAIDAESLRGSSINVYTHMSQRVLGEEKKDDKGNTYRDESSAILVPLAKEFEEKYGIKVNFEISQTEADIEPLLQVADPAVDVFTNPTWSIEKWQAYTEPYFTLEEGRAVYGEYADSMPNDGTNIFSVMPAINYDFAVIYNEEALKSVGYDAIPETVEEFTVMCEKLRDGGITPISMHRVENWPLDNMKGFSNYLTGENDTFDAMLKSDTPFSPEEPMGKTIKMYTEWKAKGFFEPEMYTDFGVAMDSVAYGKSAMMLFGSWVVPQIQGRVEEGKDASIIKVAPAPDFGKGRLVTTAPADNYAIAKGSKNKDAARLFIEFVASNAQFIADSGFIANKAGVTPVVPEMYAIIDEAVASGQANVIYAAASTENKIHNEEVLSEANLLADTKWAGNLFDALDITKPDDWAAYDKQVQKQNEAYAEAKEFLDYQWID